MDRPGDSFLWLNVTEIVTFTEAKPLSLQGVREALGLCAAPGKS